MVNRETYELILSRIGLYHSIYRWLERNRSFWSELLFLWESLLDLLEYHFHFDLDEDAIE